MGQTPSLPQPGTKLQVIGAGLPRTGTSSFSLALTHLLSGPVYHGGTQATLGPPHEILSWITLLSSWPPTTPAAKSHIHKILKERLDGYAAVTDSPCNGLVEELLEVWPNAIVICTMRDPEAWVKSMATVANASTLWFLRAVLFLLPTMRHFPDYIDELRKQWVTLYHKPEPADLDHWNRHIAYLKRVVPEKQLVFYDVRQGWGPLCKALQKEVPDVEFPRVNDSKAIDELAKKMIMRGLVRWCIVLGAAAAGGLGWWWARL
jgi:hypothetical protein